MFNIIVAIVTPSIAIAFSTLPWEAIAQADNFRTVRAAVRFDKPLQDWDGFGVNYVETAQTPDYAKYPQDYGGFSILSEAKQQEILDLIFGDDGLKPGIVKMFLDPFHQTKPNEPFDHQKTTANMRYFVREGLKRTRSRGDNLSIITTLYGPPAYVTQQQFLRGRDLNPEYKEYLARYLIDWVKYLREEESFPVNYLSLHNEGESWDRWPANGASPNWEQGHDYNMFWSPELVVEFLRFMRPMMDAAGLQDVGLTPGETTNWFRFYSWGYADAIADNREALNNLGLITSHGFYMGEFNSWFSGSGNPGANLLQAKRPEVHTWVTSTSWSDVDTEFVQEIYGNIYLASSHAIIPWACIQRPAQWLGGDPNPGTAIKVLEDGTYELLPGYYFFKQVSRAGQPGMAVARTSSMDSEIAIIGFASKGTKHPDAMVMTNVGVPKPWENDSVEVFIDVGNDKTQTYGSNDYQYIFGYGSNKSMVETKHKKEEGVQFATQDTEEGYVMEVALPWSTLGVTPSTDVRLGFDVQVNDDDGGGRDGKRSWHAKSDQAWSSPKHLGTLELSTTASQDGTGVVQSIRVDKAIAIDGRSEAAWSNAPAHALSNTLVGTAIADTDLKATWQTLYDDEYLYVLVTVNDEKKQATQDGKRVALKVVGSDYTKFEAFRTTDKGDRYRPLGIFEVKDGVLMYELPPRSVTTFFGVN